MNENDPASRTQGAESNCESPRHPSVTPRESSELPGLPPVVRVPIGQNGDDVQKPEDTENIAAETSDLSADSPLSSDRRPTSDTEVKGRSRRKRRVRKEDAAEQRLLGRRALCQGIADIAPNMLKTVKLRVLGRHVDSTRGMDDADLTTRIIEEAAKLAEPDRVTETLLKIDPDLNRRHLRDIILFTILLQEETHSLEENRLAAKVMDYERTLVAQAQELDFFDPKKHDVVRAHHYDTYRIVLEAAWHSDDHISLDEANLLAVLRDRLSISLEEHRLIGASIGRFPKADCMLHTPDEIHDARKELQRDAILWSYRDENNANIDIIPSEIVDVLREHIVGLELQRTNFGRMVAHDCVNLSDLRDFLQKKEMDRYGVKAELAARIVESDVKPSEFLNSLDRDKLAEMCRLVGLKSSGIKADLIERLIGFYDDLTFEERETQDEREDWYNNYELLASRAYADLRAKKLISKDLDVEHQFEKATDFLFEVMLNVTIDNSRTVTKADGRIPLEHDECILWDCKSVEVSVNLQDHLEPQFDGYLRLEREQGRRPLAFFVIAPSFSVQSVKLANQFKARTNWDIALIQADALKHLADKWYAIEPDKPFPIRLLNRTEIIDKDRADFLLSLA